MSRESDKVVSLASYRVLRASRRPARPFLIWQPGLGYQRSDALAPAGQNPPMLAHQRGFRLS